MFEQPDLFRSNYAYTMDVVRTSDRARRLAQAWYQLDAGIGVALQTEGGACLERPLPAIQRRLCRLRGRGAIAIDQRDWVDTGHDISDRGGLSSDTKDLLGRTFESTSEAETRRADAFLDDYKTRKATMVAQPLMSAAEVRRRLLGAEGRVPASVRVSSRLGHECRDWRTAIPVQRGGGVVLDRCMSGIHGARLVIKTHPLDSEKREDALREILGDRGTVVSDIHPHVLIEAADCVSVRNSTLGFEALCYAKPLLLLEQAKYKHPRVDAGGQKRRRGRREPVEYPEPRVPPAGSGGAPAIHPACNRPLSRSGAVSLFLRTRQVEYPVAL